MTTLVEVIRRAKKALVSGSNRARKGTNARAIVAVVALLIAQRASATSLSFLGLEFCKPLPIQECSAGADGGADKPLPDTPCFKRVLPDETGPVMNGYVSLVYPRGKLPSWILNPVLDGLMVNGRFSQVIVKTAPASAETILDTLTAKYGKPLLLDRKMPSRQAGTTSKRVTAAWNLPDLIVFFNSEQDGQKFGALIIETHEKVAVMKAREQQYREHMRGKRPGMAYCGPALNTLSRRARRIASRLAASAARPV